MGEEQRDDEEGPSGVRITERDAERRPPPKYRVVILNDEIMSVGFVMMLVKLFFGKSTEDALLLAREIRDRGEAVAGIYTHEIAETKVVQAQLYAHGVQQPLMITMEPEE